MSNRNGLERTLSRVLAGVCGIALVACSGDDGSGGGGASGQGSPMAGAGGTGGAGAAGASGVGGATGGAGGTSSTAGMGGMSAGMSGAGGSAGSTQDSGLEPNDAGMDSGDDDAALPAPSDELIGWASMDALGVNGTTGGEGGEVVTATTAAQLLEHAASGERLVIQIQGVIRAPRVVITSNKTLRGMNGARIEGGLRIRGASPSQRVSNVIIQDLAIDGSSSNVDGDAVQVYYAHHVWIDHCEIFDAADGNLDIVHAADYVTVSWTKFRYSHSAPASDHRFCNLIGHDDPNAEDEGKLNVTFHHNWWAERVIERMPRVRYGKVHSLNNYFSSAGNNYVIRAGFRASILIEGNYFDGVDTPHEIDGAGASVVAMNNIYDGTDGAQDTAGSAFDPPYDYTVDPPASIPALVMASAGPR